jgi:hypothetical protein
MVEKRDVLTDLRFWFDGRCAGLADRGLQVEFTESPPARAKRSLP